MTTVASTIVNGLADLGVRHVWGVVGDALNPITEVIRLDDRIEWVGVRHEEAAAFAAAAQAQLSGTLGVCMGTVGPGSVHLLNGLYDAKKSHARVLAICGQVPTSEIGSNFFQEVDNNAVFADVSVFHATVTAGSQMPYLLEQAVNAAFAKRGVAVLTVPGDVGEHGVVVDLLEEVAAQLRSRHLPADRQHRRMRLLGVVQPIQEVQRAGTHRAHAHPNGAGELGLGASGESGHLLVTHADPLDVVVEPDSLGDRVQCITDDTPNLAHTEIGERVDNGGRDGGHGTP